MPWMEWIAQKHPALVHLPVAAALLLPLPLLAAQRPGRGIRPWWTVCRYLTVMGLLGAIFALVSGLAWGRMLELIPAGAWMPPKEAEGLGQLLRRHQQLALAGLGLGALTLWAVTRPRKEHESLGPAALLLGCLWAATYLWTGLTGGAMTHPPLPPLTAEPEAPVASIPVAPPEPATMPVHLLDYQALEPMHAEPVKSPEHGGRWIRVWVNPAAKEAYRKGAALPADAVVVLHSLEDRWGRPGLESGPLLALEGSNDGGPRFTYYWPRVPDAARKETHGEATALWREGNPSLRACLDCHAQGPSDPARRSTWVVPRRPVAPAP